MGREILKLLPVVAVSYAAGWTSSTSVRSAAGAERASVPPVTATDSLVDDFNAAWNAQDLGAMADRLQPSAFFLSPFQLRYGSTEMLETVLQRNPRTFRNVVNEEAHSFVSETLAWSIGTIESDIYDANGVRTPERFDSEYLYVFTPDPTGTWRVQMLVYHEACE